jgi:hypothetical protein
VTAGDFVFLTLGVGWMSVTWVVMEWWFRARAMWLSRLSARALLAGSYTPAPANIWLGGLKWMLRQRVAVPDLARMGRLEDEVDEDRFTEVWRVRTTRRFRLALAAGVGGLVLLGFAFSLYEFLGWQAFDVFVVLTVAAAFFPGRALFRRAREWGDHGPDLIT